MAVKDYYGTPYHLWNPFTAMDEFLPYLEFGAGVITRGKGPYVFNHRGKRFINGFSSLWNVAIGHGREELVEAAAEQMRELAYSPCFRRAHPRAIELAAKLVEITQGHYEYAFLGSNGSEAIETAIKMARQYHRQSPDANDRGRYKIVSLQGSYHGVSYGALSTSGLESDAVKYGPLLPGFLHIEAPYCYRCPYGQDGYPQCGLECAQALENAIQTEGAETVAAFVMEPIMGVAGIITPPEEYFQRVGETCHRNGVLFIADEVSTGFGRTGKLFAIEDWDPKPDILCLGKGISSGYLPLAATLATDAVFQRFAGRGNQFDHGSTASGHPVCAAVGLANIDILVRERLSANAAQVGAFLKSRLDELASKRTIIGDIRGKGLFIGLELVQDRETKTPLSEKQMFNIMLNCVSLGLLVYLSPQRQVIILVPPLIIDEKIADSIVKILDKALTASAAA